MRAALEPAPESPCSGAVALKGDGVMSDQERKDLREELFGRLEVAVRELREFIDETAMDPWERLEHAHASLLAVARDDDLDEDGFESSRPQLTVIRGGADRG